VIVDSDVLIDFLRNDVSAVRRIAELKNRGELATTSINSFELFKGLGLKDSSKMQILSGFLGNFRIFDFNFEVSVKAGEIFSDLKERGEGIDLADVMIASIAISNGEALLTRNRKHFSRIKNLKVEDV
jgi:predicted nucleic acid-binding protein